jgi:ornithine cyclodeaminase/alanine dehydrogenase-like protein (mu-crystallin family)
MKLTLLSADDLRAALPMPAAIEAMKSAFAALSTGRADVPLRLALSVPQAGGTSLFMPAYVPPNGALGAAGASPSHASADALHDGALGAKIVSIFPRNAERGRPMIHGLVVVLDAETGEPVALCDGTFLTAWRTGAASGAATDLLARPDAATAALFGCGAQARTQALAVDAVRRLERLRVYAPTPAHVQQFIAEMQPQINARLVAAASPAEAVSDADVVCAATTSATPVFDGALLKPGAHVNGVGSYTTRMQEVDAATVGRARLFVDSREAALAEAGDLVIPMRAGQTRAEDWVELGEVAAGLRPGRQSPDEITFFKSVGVAVQDVVAAGRALAEAKARGLGQVVGF